MNEEEFGEDADLSEWTLQLEKIRSDSKSATVTRLLAASLMLNPYMTIGEFFKTISDEDLQILVERVSEFETLSEGGQDILLIAMMLAQAEGTPASNMDELHEYVNAMCIFIAGASLARKGLVKAFYENMSFGPDMREAKVFQRLH